MARVSVIIPTYNSASLISQAISSVLGQTYDDYEILVIDDGSNDDTQERLKPYLGRISYFYQDNQERSAARNAGIARASGEYLAFLDADDYWLPRYLERQVINLNAHPEYALSRTWVYHTDGNGQRIRIGGNGAADAKTQEELLRVLLIHNCMSSIAVMARTDIVRSVGGFDPGLRQAEDWDLWLRIALHHGIGAVPEPLACYRHWNVFMPDRMRRRGVEDAHVRIVTRAFEQLHGSPLYALRARSLGHAYWQNAWINYALANFEVAKSFLTRSFQEYPDFFAAPHQDFIEAVAYQADALYDLATPLDEALVCIDRMFANLPEWALSLSALRQRARGQYYGIHFFRSHERNDPEDMLRTVLPAVACNPGWLKNRGFLSLSLRSALGVGLSRAGHLLGRLGNAGSEDN